MRRSDNKDGSEATKDTEWIAKIDEKIQNKKLARLNDIAVRQPKSGGYERVITNTITCIQSIKTTLNNPLYDTDYKNTLTIYLLKLIEHQNKYIRDSSVIISNIAAIFAIEYLDNDILFSEVKKH